MLLEFQPPFLGLTNIMDSVYKGWAGGRGVGWALGAGGEL